MRTRYTIPHRQLPRLKNLSVGYGDSWHTRQGMYAGRRSEQACTSVEFLSWDRDFRRSGCLDYRVYEVNMPSAGKLLYTHCCQKLQLCCSRRKIIWYTASMQQPRKVHVVRLLLKRFAEVMRKYRLEFRIDRIVVVAVSFRTQWSLGEAM